MANYAKTKALVTVTKNLSKKGKLKGKNKSETKNLKGMCQHHKLNKKGKVVPTIYNNGETCTCYLCGYQFRADFYTNEEIKSATKSFKEVLNQAKFIGVASNCGDKTNDFLSELGVMVENSNKVFKKVRNIAQKQGTVKDKKKKHNGKTGSDSYGSWGKNN